MKKYRTSEFLDEIDSDGVQSACPSNFDHNQLVYIASEVDARLAELKQWLAEAKTGSQYPDHGGGYDNALEDVEAKLTELMGRSSND